MAKLQTGLEGLASLPGFASWLPHGYPIDFNAGLDYSRNTPDLSIHPYPQMIGAVSGLCPLFDANTVLPQTASSGWGTSMSVLVSDQSPPFMQNSFDMLQKVRG